MGTHGTSAAELIKEKQAEKEARNRVNYYAELKRRVERYAAQERIDAEAAKLQAANVGTHYGFIAGAAWQRKQAWPKVWDTYFRGSNPVLEAAIKFYLDQQHGNNPKSWAHVARVMDKAWGKFAEEDVTAEQFSEALEILKGWAS